MRDGRIERLVQRIRNAEERVLAVDLWHELRTDADVADVVDGLLTRPDTVVQVSLGGNRLTDETGLKLARYVAASSSVCSLDLSDNSIGEATYLALAAALCVNTSLVRLTLTNSAPVARSRVDAAYVHALRVNPSRHHSSAWFLHATATSTIAAFYVDDDYQRLRALADQLGHPSMQCLLVLCV